MARIASETQAVYDAMGRVGPFDELLAWRSIESRYTSLLIAEGAVEVPGLLARYETRTARTKALKEAERAAYHTEMARKYERIASDPSEPLPPDLAEP